MANLPGSTICAPKPYCSRAADAEPARWPMNFSHKLLILLCHKFEADGFGRAALAYCCWQHGQRGRRRARATVRL